MGLDKQDKGCALESTGGVFAFFKTSRYHSKND